MRRALVAASVGALGAFAIVACSLGLDESLIDKIDAGPLPTDAPAQEAALDAPSDGPPPIMPEGGVCTKDQDCMGASDMCVKPRCDVPRKACVVDVCKPAACLSSACDETARTCAAPKMHKFLAAQWPVGAAVGCGGNPRGCFAAVWPYVFVGTPAGVVAFAADDPGTATPVVIPVTGLGFVPGQVLQSGSRVYFLGGVTSAPMSTSSRLQIAYIDVPPDPFRKSLAVTTVLVTYNRPTSEPGFSLGLLPRANDTALLVDFNIAQSFPSTPVEPPLIEPLSLGSTAIPFSAGYGIVASSGTRLVMDGQYDGNTGILDFELIANAGATATNGGPVPIPGTVAPVYPTQTFAVDPQGGMVWLVEALSAPPGCMPGPCSYVKAVKAYFLLADGAANFDFTQGTDVETYALPPAVPSFGAGAALVGPAAMIDSSTALVATADKNNANQTNIQIVTRMPLGVMAMKKQLITTNAVGTLGAAASGGYGYILAAESATASTVYVFDPACAQ